VGEPWYRPILVTVAVFAAMVLVGTGAIMALRNDAAAMTGTTTTPPPTSPSPPPKPPPSQEDPPPSETRDPIASTRLACAPIRRQRGYYCQSTINYCHRN
jgi:hypothetical protein